jgi:hypothetical protein
MAKKPKKAGAEPVSAVRRVTKQDLVLSMLRRQDGASIAEICVATDWKAHSARAFLSGALGRRLRIAVISEKNEAGERKYFVAPIKAPE